MKLFTVMICTLPERKESFDRLMHDITNQTMSSGLGQEVEFIYDDTPRGEITTGDKRNKLTKRAESKFCAFIDDDDEVHPQYVKLIVDTIKQYDDLDCIGFWGEIYFQGVLGGKMIHSIACDNWTEKPGIYYRPPNHLNPVRTELVRQSPFRDITISEDHFWSVDLKRNNTLKKEVFLGTKEPLYVYKCGVGKKGL